MAVNDEKSMRHLQNLQQLKQDLEGSVNRLNSVIREIAFSTKRLEFYISENKEVHTETVGMDLSKTFEDCISTSNSLLESVCGGKLVVETTEELKKSTGIDAPPGGIPVL